MPKFSQLKPQEMVRLLEKNGFIKLRQKDSHLTLVNSLHLIIQRITMQDCIFCKIIKNEIPSHKVYEDESVLAFLDINPINIGHTLVIPKEHYKDLLDMPPELAAQLMNVAQKIAPKVLVAVEADSFNLGVNNGANAGQVVMHAHFHVMPRFAGDGHSLWHGREISQEELARISAKIRDNL